ncbi:DUF2939 domain-containing protein [Hymenobacter cavernae]|uniref:DUF2939 domain-containing protein n=1 Tax=Hymenobacter cavernae TaxID=2044852 RepID=A0ABQ1TSP8_9BACT|nr:DUF2939 domain-containing protein [Hymenobacter cavernae]GGF02855.1 hypothetical protein GCM10011383_12200 [Hymenobacter cavernae]
MKKVLVLLVLLGLLIGGYFYYRSLAAGPTYALMQAARAFQTHDVAGFEQYVDVRSVSSNLINQVADQSEALGIPGSNSLLLQGALQALRPQLAEVARQEVQHFVESGTPPNPDQLPSTPLGKVSVLGVVDNVVGASSRLKGIKYVRKDGDQALVGVELAQPRYDTTMVIELKMHNEGDHWQVKEIANARELVKRFAQLKKQELNSK